MSKNENLIKLENLIDNFIKEQSKKYKNQTMLQRKINHIKRTASIAEENFENNYILKIAMKFHDIGRFKQYDLIGSFNDKVFNHYILGIETINEYITTEDFKNTKELEMIKAVILYHSGVKYIPPNIELDCKTLELIDLAQRIDALDNGCMGALIYIEEECLNDSKKYKKNNPNMDMKTISNDVLKFYLKGETFDKLTYCNTYADYILFAASLAIQSLKGADKIIAKQIMNKKCGKYENALVGYKDLFEKYIDSSKVSECMQCLYNYYN